MYDILMYTYIYSDKSVWWWDSASILRRLRQEGYSEFKTSLGYIHIK